MAVQDFVPGLEFVQADIGQTLAIAVIDVLAWIIVNFKFGFAVFAVPWGIWQR